MTQDPYGGPHADPYGQGMQPGAGGQPGQPEPPANGYPFGPFAPDQGAAGPFAESWDPTAGQQDEYFAQPPAGPQPGRGRRTLLIVGISALALVILGIGSAIVAINLLQARNTERRSGATTGPSSSAPPAAGARPSDAVFGYLTALASGDAQEALAYGQSQPTESSLLTDKALATALKDAPLTAIEVPHVDGHNEAAVEASYKLGKRSVTETFDVVKQQDAWKLRRVAAEVDLGLVRSGAVPLLINGAQILRLRQRVNHPDHEPQRFPRHQPARGAHQRQGQDGGGSGGEEELRQVSQERRPGPGKVPEPLDVRRRQVAQGVDQLEAARFGPVQKRQGDHVGARRPGPDPASRRVERNLYPRRPYRSLRRCDDHRHEHLGGIAGDQLAQGRMAARTMRKGRSG